MSASPDKPDLALDGVQVRRRRARRTAIVIGLIALCIYAGFIVSGVVAQ
ncbi:MAG: hypothetical protein ACREO8_00510 [Luteimonas sp.]